MKTKASAPANEPTVTMEREIAAAPSAVYRAFTDPDAMKLWYGPNGFTITVLSMDFRVGGLYRFIMHGPDGTDYPSRHEFREIVPDAKLAYRHGSDFDNDPDAFDVAVTFAPSGTNSTLLTMRSTFSSIEARNAVMKFNAVELGRQTVEKLAAFVEGKAPA